VSAFIYFLDYILDSTAAAMQHITFLPLQILKNGMLAPPPTHTHTHNKGKAVAALQNKNK